MCVRGLVDEIAEHCHWVLDPGPWVLDAEEVEVERCRVFVRPGRERFRIRYFEQSSGDICPAHDDLVHIDSFRFPLPSPWLLYRHVPSVRVIGWWFML